MDLNDYISKARESFVKEEKEEVSLEKGSMVFCFSEEVDGWVYVRTMSGESGYAPASYLNPLVLKFLERDTIHSRSSDIISSNTMGRDIHGSVVASMRTARSGAYATFFYVFELMIRGDIDRVSRRAVNSATQISQRRSIQRTKTENTCTSFSLPFHV